MAANPTMAGTLGLKAVDSNEVRKKQVGLTHSIKEVRDSPTSETTSGSPIYNNPLKLCDMFSTPTKFKPFKPLDLYPQNQKSPVIQIQSPSNFGSLPVGDVECSTQTSTPHPNAIPDLVRNSSIKNPNFTNSTPINDIPTQPTSDSPTLPRPNSACKDQLDGEAKIAALVQALEDEMQRAGTRVDCAALRTQLIQLQTKEISPEGPSLGTSTSNSLKIGFHYPSPSHLSPTTPTGKPPSEPVITAQSTEQTTQQPKTKDWASLFHSQGRSNIMKLSHFPDLQQGEDAVVELEDSHCNDRSWNNCLIGYFLDGKMAFPLLSATARKIWKDYGRIKIKQVGACYFFEFQDEEAKLKVLEGGPYFFSRRYLVLKDWHRMLVPSTDHPTTIPAWVKIHKLPLECWTEEGLSRITSTMGRPLHVDIATAQQQRLDYARVCVEVSASSELPKTIQIKHGLESVTVHLEYQWLPSKCDLCKVFGHTCKPKVETQDTNNESTWKQMGKALGGGGGVLEALTKEIPNNPTGAAFVMQPDKEGVVFEDLSDDAQSEAAEEIRVETNASSSTVPSLVNQVSQSVVEGSSERGQITQKLSLPAGNSLETLTSYLSDPPDGYNKAGSSKKNNKKSHKRANTSGKGGGSATPNKSR